MPPANSTPPRDWDVLKLEYAKGNESLRAFAKARDLPFQTVSRRATKEGWVQARSQFRDKAESIAQEKLANERAANIHSKAATLAAEQEDWNKRDLDLAKALRAMVVVQITNAQKRDTKGDLVQPLTANQLRTLTSTVGELQKIGRLALNLTTDNQGISDPAGGPVQHLSGTLEQLREAVRDVQSSY